MRKLKIVADSACDVFTLSGCDFSSAPLKLITAEREFVDDEALDVDEMVAYMSKYKGRSRSSCPSIGDWLEAFDGADDVFCVTITSGLSGSYNSAFSAKQAYESENEGKRVFIVDSLSAGPEITLIVEKLGECVKEGKTYEEIAEIITEYRKNTGLLFMLKSLRSLANNGRVSPLVAKAIGVLGICIVGKASDEGTLAPMHKCRGERRSLETMVSSLAAEGFKSGRVSIGHCQNEEGAYQLKKLILEKYPDAVVDVHRLKGLCSFYAEMGGILMGFEKSN